MSFLSKKNIYTCEGCGAHIVTVDVDDGTTPYLTPCTETSGCGRLMRSSLYRVDQNMKPSHEWYRPSSTAEFSQHTRDHVEKGGLLLRRITQ